MRSVFGKVWVGITVPLLVLALVTHPGFWDTTRSAPVAIACVDLVAAVVSKGNCCCPWPRNTLTTACGTQNDCVCFVVLRSTGPSADFWSQDWLLGTHGAPPLVPHCFRTVSYPHRSTHHCTAATLSLARSARAL